MPKQRGDLLASGRLQAVWTAEEGIGCRVKGRGDGCALQPGGSPGCTEVRRGSTLPSSPAATSSPATFVISLSCSGGVDSKAWEQQALRFEPALYFLLKRS